LLRSVRACFNNVKAPVCGKQGKKRKISLADSLMSAIAIFSIKYPSLLKFDQSRNKDYVKHNLNSLYGIKQAPSDTYVREQLDEVNPSDLRSAFTLLFSHLQRGKALEKYAYLNGKYILSVDGTGFFSSKKVFCKNCNQKHHRDGSTTYYHQILGASIVHPDHKEVIPICPEPIMNADGNAKNDCERNASVRLLKDFRREHPHLPVIVVEDALASNAPHIRLLQDLNMDFVTVVKPGGNNSLFEWLQGVKMETYSFTDKNGITHKFNFKDTLPINDSNPDLEVNFLEYWTYNRKGKQTYHNTWITNIPITKNNVFKLAQGGRARWKIESVPQAHKKEVYHNDELRACG